MNINFNPLIKSILPFSIVLILSYFFNSLLYFYLPKVSIEQVKSNILELDFNRYNFKDSYDLIKAEPIVAPKVEVKKIEYELISNLTLKAIYSTENENGWIIISENKNNETHILSKGEMFKNYELIKIFSSYVIFKKGSSEYKLELNENKNIKYEVVSKNEETNTIEESIKVNENEIKVTRNYLNSYVNDINKIWNNIAIKEIYVNGKIDGFKINNIKKGSAFEKLGLKTGDILKAINNMELKSYNDAFKVYNKINTLNYLNIKILRNNTEMEINYEIN